MTSTIQDFFKAENLRASPLPALGAGAATVSGFSAGGFMSSQVHVAYSGTFEGAGVLAGGPYWCTHGTLTYLASCTILDNSINMRDIYRQVSKAERARTIDKVRNLTGDKVWL